MPLKASWYKEIIMDPNSGRLYNDPTPEEIKKHNLVLVNNPTKTQLKDMQVKPNQRCPCGSGKKAKNCCLKGNRVGYGLSRWGGRP